MFLRGVPRILSSDQMGDRGKVPAVFQAGIRRLNDVVLTPMRRDAVASTLVKNHFDHLFLLDLKRYVKVSELGLSVLPTTRSYGDSMYAEEGDMFLNSIVSCDGTWVHMSEPEIERQSSF